MGSALVIMSNLHKLGVLAVLILLLYSHVLVGLLRDWWTDLNYSHGFLIPFIGGYLVWKKKAEVIRIPIRPATSGLLIVGFSLFMLVIGSLGAELFLQRVSLLILIAGIILFLAGKAYLKSFAFPLLLLLLMIPLPAIIFYQITLPLQLLASRCATAFIGLLNLPVAREGNIIHLSNISLAVVEACSGIRSLFSLLTLGIVTAYFSQESTFKRILISLLTIPIAIMANAVRVTLSAVFAYYFGSGLAERFYHTVSGWLIFFIAFAFIFLVVWMLSRHSRDVDPKPDPPNPIELSAPCNTNLPNLAFYVTIPILIGSMVVLNTLSHGEPVVIRNSLTQFPLRIGNWSGSDTTIGESVLKVLRIKDYLSRIYLNNHSHNSLMLYIGYYPSQREGDTIHSPKNCLPGSGWEVIHADFLTITRSGEPIKINKYLVQKGTEQDLILYWYQSRGRVIASEYWSKIYLVVDAIGKNRTDGALVRISLPVIHSVDETTKQGVDFIQSLLPVLSNFIPD